MWDILDNPDVDGDNSISFFPFNPFFNYNCYIDMSFFVIYNSSLLNSESEIDPSYAEMITKDQAFYIFQFTLYTLVCSIIQIFGYI